VRGERKRERQREAERERQREAERKKRRERGEIRRFISVLACGYKRASHREERIYPHRRKERIKLINRYIHTKKKLINRYIHTKRTRSI
jgi:hypothetical protein